MSLARQITSRHDLDDVLGDLFRWLRPLLTFTGGSIQLLDDEGWIRLAAIEPAAPPRTLARRVPLGGSLAGRVVLTESPVYLTDVRGRVAAHAEDLTDDVRSWLGVPLVADGQAIGLLQIESPAVAAWTDDERALVVCVAPVLAAAIQNARAHARESLAHARAATVEDRLETARALLAAARGCADRGDWLEVERHLARVDAALAGRRDLTAVRLPQQRRTVALPASAAG
jgi:GAF domain-containing protein